MTSISKIAPKVFSKIELNLVELGAVSTNMAKSLIGGASKGDLINSTRTTLFLDIPIKRKLEIQETLKSIELSKPSELPQAKEKIIDLIEELKEEKRPPRIIV